MTTFVNKKNKKDTIIVLTYKVHEGDQAWHISGENLSLPKDDWKLKK